MPFARIQKIPIRQKAHNCFSRMPTHPSAPIEASLRRELKRRGHALKPGLQVGKAGLSDAILAAAARALSADPLLKVRLAQPALADELAERAGAVVLATVGRNALLYRPSPEVPDDPS